MTHANHSKIDPSRLGIIAEELIHKLPEGYKGEVLNLPRCIITDGELSADAVAALCFFLAEGGFYKTSVSKLRARWKWGRPRALRAVNRLQSAGYLI